METDGQLRFNYTFVGPCFGCSFEINDLGYYSASYFSGINRLIIVPVVAGAHVITFRFRKPDATANSRLAKIIMTEISLTGVSTGGAGDCTTCPNGSVSPGLVSFCTACQPGSSNNWNNTACTLCPANTFNDRVGNPCLQCGTGTWSQQGATTCNTNCTFVLDNYTVFDLSPLNGPTMYGPITAQGHIFYLSLCQKATTNQTCYTDTGAPTNSYICQVLFIWN